MREPSGIGPEHIERWVEHARRSPWQALLLLRHSNARFRAAIPVPEMAAAWQRWAERNPDRAMQHLSVLSPEACRFLTPTIAQLARRNGYTTGLAEVLDVIPISDGPGTEGLIRRLFVILAGKLPARALEWVAEARAPLRNSLPLPIVHRIWREELRRDPKGAIEWAQRVPKKMLPLLGREEVAQLLATGDAGLRLEVMRLTGSLSTGDTSLRFPYLPAHKQGR